MSPDKQAEPKPTVTKNSSEFYKDAYASIPPGELVVFAVQVLQADGSPAAPEDVVSICFRFFPHSFALKNYFYWPDSALVTRRLHDAKEKGLLKGNAADGFEVKVQGRQVAKHVAKALGVVFPAPPKVEVPPAPVEEKKVEPEAPARIEEKVIAAPPRPKKKTTAAERVDKSKKPQKKKAVKKQAVKRIKKPAVKKKPAVIKKAVVTKPTPKSKPKAIKPVLVKKPAPKPKAGRKQAKPVKKAKTAVKPIVKARPKPQPKVQVKPAPKVKVEKPKPQKKQKRVAKQAKATQLTMPLAPPAAWKKVEAPATKPKVREAAPPVGDKKPVKKEAAAPVVASKEEKVKAAKVVKQIEHSDAYRSYRRSGRRAIIGEFDFRNMLFATMESSAETLKRNMDLFKRYAGIHFRADLIAFLDFCEEKFSALLVSKIKVKGRR